MAGIKELLHPEEDGSLSFGDYSLASKTKLEDFKYKGDIYKVKTFRDITRLEKNDSFLYESTPGSSVYNMKYANEGVNFSVESYTDIQLTLDLQENSEYEIEINNEPMGTMKTGLSGKLSFSVELDSGVPVPVNVRQV